MGEGRRRRVGFSAALGVLTALCGSSAGAAGLDDFGYLSIKTDGVESRGNRPLLTILASFAGKPACPPVRAYFDNLVFNLLQQSVNGYYLVNSNGRFFWRARARAPSGRSTSPRPKATCRRGSGSRGSRKWPWSPASTSPSSTTTATAQVTTDELSILIIDNLSERGAANRASDPVGVQAGGAR